MQLNIGNYNLSFERRGKDGRATRDSAPVVLNMQAPQSPFILNASGHPQQNIQLIRETVAACMHARSEAISRGRFHAYTIVESGERRAENYKNTNHSPLSTLHSPLPADHPLEKLLQNPNPLFDLSDMLELSSQWLDATGNALWLKVRNGNGVVTELWPVATLSFTIERGADQLPALYRFQPMNVAVPAEDIIHIRRADIRSAPFFGHAVLSDILETAKAETAVRLFQSRFFENDATPRAVLRWPAGSMMTQEQMDRVRDSWQQRYASPDNAGRIGILPDGGEVQLIANGAKELDFVKSKADLRNAIREAFKVPQIVLGDVADVNLTNAETSYMVFMRDVVDYALAKHARAFTRALASEFSTGNINTMMKTSIVIEHEPVVAETEERFMSRVSELKQAMTIDEQRALVNLPPLPDGKGKAFLINGEFVGV
jgi:HK97 family phage portal protein